MQRTVVFLFAAVADHSLRAGALALAAACVWVSSVQAEVVGTYPHRNGSVYLMSNLCHPDKPGAGQRALQTVGTRDRHGCWGVDRAGNPVVTWSDGSELALDDSVKLRPAQRIANAAMPAASVPSVPSARPAWCPQARFPHERQVCNDATLAERDLRLASLWKPYRRMLSPAAQAWQKSDYFHRLKVCGADKTCIASEQQEQMRRYRNGLAAGG